MKIVGCDLHARQQSIALLDTETGELLERMIEHEADQVREFYASLTGPVVVGIEATGAMQWFLQLMEELEIECRVGHPAKIRAAETRQQKHDRRDALLTLRLLLEKRFPTIWRGAPIAAARTRRFSCLPTRFAACSGENRIL
jgi:transposase